VILLLAAASTVLLGINVKDNSNYLVWSRNVALVLGALSTFLVGLSALFNIESYWLKQKVLFARVRALRERCCFQQAEEGGLSPGAIETAFFEYRAIMDERIEYWEKLAAENESVRSSARRASGKSQGSVHADP
jgi:hypothetical protein